jgi:hypothetical protein
VKTWKSTVIAVVAALSLGSGGSVTFEQYLGVIDKALANNPAAVPQQNLDACKPMRDMAVKLHEAKMDARAIRRLKMCRRLLGLDE